MRLRRLVFASFITLSVGCSLAPAAKPTSQSPVTITDATLVDNGSSTQGRGMGRGNGRNGGLPPGIAKNLAVGKPLPPGIAKQYLAPNVLLRLPPLKEGYEYVVVAGKVLLIAIATQVVHDILEDVLLD